MNGKLLLLILLIFLLLLLPGCWDYVEYENLALVTAMGIDMDEQSDQVIVSIQHMIPASTGGGGGKSQTSPSNVGIRVASGLTIADAVTKIQQVVGRRLFYGYMSVEIVGEDAAKNIMEDIMVMNDRTPSIRNTADLIIASGKASDAISTIETNIPVPSGKHIRDLIEESKGTGNAFPVTIEDFIEYMEVVGVEPMAPCVITTVSKKQEGNRTSDGSSGGSQGTEGMVGQQEGYHRIDGMAAFKGGVFAGWLDGTESRGLAWITGKSMMLYESVKTSGDFDTKGTLFFRVLKPKGSIKVKLDDGKPVFNINVYAEADLRKYAMTMEPQNLTPDVINTLQNYLESKIRSDIEAAIKKGQKELKTDIFGFGSALYRQHPKLWHSMYEQKWEDVFPDVSVNVNVKTKVINTGTTVMKFFVK